MTDRSINTISSHAAPLTEENFSDWLIDTRAHLRSKKLWKYTQELYDGPEAEDGETSAATKKRKEWVEKAEEAADLMTPTITPAVKKKLTEVEFNDGQKMLARLSTILQPATDLQFMRLTKEYYTLNWNDFKSAAAFLDHVKVLEERIDATKVELTPDKRTILCLTMALPEAYRYTTQVWALTPNITADQAKEMLLEEERTQDHNDVEKTALAARFGKQAKLTGHGKGEEGNCPTCGKPGHGNDKCWKLHPELVPERYASSSKSTRLVKSF